MIKVFAFKLFFDFCKNIDIESMSFADKICFTIHIN